MARQISDFDNPGAPTADYEYGYIKDNPGDNTGTKINEKSNQDIQQLMQRALAKSGITPNGLPDNTTNGYQLAQAFGVDDWTNITGTTFSVNSGTITVDAGDIIYNRYRQSGKTIWWQLQIQNATITGSPSTVGISLPSVMAGGFANDGQIQATCAYSHGVNTLDTAFAFLNSPLDIFLAGGGTFTAGSNNQNFYINIVAELA